MKTGEKVKSFLSKKKARFEVISHPKRETAVQTAEAEHVPAWKFVKVVIGKVKGEDAMFVLPADRRLDLFKITTALGTRDVRIDEEQEFSDLFPDCEKGAMPPFGALYGLACYADAELENLKEIYFNAGSHKESIKMAFADYLRLAEAEIGDYSVPHSVGVKAS